MTDSVWETGNSWRRIYCG